MANDTEADDTQSSTSDSWKRKLNVLDHLSALIYGESKYFKDHITQVRKVAIKSLLTRFETVDTTMFFKRITSMSWSPEYVRNPYLIGTGDKFGNFLLLNGKKLDNNSRCFSPIYEKEGEGPGGSILAIKFQTSENIILAGMNGRISRICTAAQKGTEEVLHDTATYERWFTSLDVSNTTNTIIAGATDGFCYLFTGSGELVKKEKLHKGKILHCEFNPRVPHLMTTSGLTDHTVKIFDLRKFSANNCLASMEHLRGCNVARFSPQNGSRLMISDQDEDIRVYRGPLWDHTLTINHPHRQFQHITPIKASWHPISENIVIGTFPTSRDKSILRPIQFFDSDTGAIVHEMFLPKNDIVNLNEFNTLGDFLASAAGRNLVIWEARANEMDRPIKALNPALSNSLRNALRGENSSTLPAPTRTKRKNANDDTDDEDPKSKKKRQSKTGKKKN